MDKIHIAVDIGKVQDVELRSMARQAPWMVRTPTAFNVWTGYVRLRGGGGFYLIDVQGGTVDEPASSRLVETVRGIRYRLGLSDDPPLAREPVPPMASLGMLAPSGHALAIRRARVAAALLAKTLVSTGLIALVAVAGHGRHILVGGIVSGIYLLAALGLDHLIKKAVLPEAMRGKIAGVAGASIT